MDVLKSVKKQVSKQIDMPTEATGDVVKFGKNGAHIPVTVKWVGKKVKMTLIQP